ncbi:contactin-associated protein-like 2 isoform X3 [Lytechinus variegatus]|uniref:contactin-associated protein-like 2 isoform X3 n=1 Tax=Lytechinus variegatus TaxID=7654 RepID=UPI001BB1E2DE|nr:contactin-associated protein-like 2 isoform X3 [Lytechinus variegatus]
MAAGLKLIGLFLCVAMATGDHHMLSSLEELAEIQRDLYLRTFEFFNDSVSTEMDKMIEKLKALESRLDDVEGRLQDYAARTGNDNEVPLEPEPELVRDNRPTTTTTRRTTMMMETTPKTNERLMTTEPTEPIRKTTTRAPTTRRTTTTQPPTTTTMPTTTPTTTMPPTTTIPTTTPMPTPLNCKEVAARGETVSGWYLIDPMQRGNPFTVYCELPKGVTSVGHTVADREIHNNGFEGPGDFQLNPVYTNATINQMKALTLVSQNCSQFIKYRCRAAVLLATEKKSGLRYGYWVSVDGEHIGSWGGAPINSGKCACALTARGCLENKNCNCDSNPKQFAIDEGIISDKPYLPVTDVRLGDTGSKKEEGYVTLGPLRCQ